MKREIVFDFRGEQFELQRRGGNMVVNIGGFSASMRQLEILSLSARGADIADIGTILNISPSTIKNTLTRAIRDNHDNISEGTQTGLAQQADKWGLIYPISLAGLQRIHSMNDQQFADLQQTTVTPTPTPKPENENTQFRWAEEEWDIHSTKFGSVRVTAGQFTATLEQLKVLSLAFRGDGLGTIAEKLGVSEIIVQSYLESVQNDNHSNTYTHEVDKNPAFAAFRREILSPIALLGIRYIGKKISGQTFGHADIEEFTPLYNEPDPSRSIAQLVRKFSEDFTKKPFLNEGQILGSEPEN
jgi:DNA-binding CsgD family transcriptional regulator